MFANRFTAMLDACVLAGALKRDLLLTLAEAEFFRVRWSIAVLDETERAIAAMARAKGVAEPRERAARARQAMEQAFDDACVVGHEFLIPGVGGPDPKDDHVVAAAVHTRAQVIVTDNLRDFPTTLLQPLGLEVRSADAFIADTVDLDPGRAVAAVARMRRRWRRPQMSPEELLRRMEAAGLTETVDQLAGHVGGL